MIQQPVSIEKKAIRYYLQIVELLSFLIIDIYFVLPDLIYESRINVKAVIETEEIILEEIYVITINCDNNCQSYANITRIIGIVQLSFFQCFDYEGWETGKH